MKRMQLFEFEDFAWFPRPIRDAMTDFIVTFHRMVGTPKLIAPLVLKALKESGEEHIVDLCSGGGGPIPDVAQALRKDHGFSGNVTLTDLYPNQAAAKAVQETNVPGLSYSLNPVSADNVPNHLNGLRTMICSFHHMPKDVARRILEDAFRKKRPFFVFELTDNAGPKFLWWLPLPLAFVQMTVMMPFVRGFSLTRFIFTFIIPVLPLIIAWDGVASNARTYSQSDLKELTADLQDNSYSWEIGAIKKRGYPAKFSYLLGLPKAL